MRENNNSFYKADLESARLAFSRWQSRQQETVDEYMMRKRRIELICLVKQVIENELSESDREIVDLHWYQGKSVTETAAIIGVNHSSISRRLDAINNIIYDKLKYALQYRYGKDYSSSVRVIIKSKDSACYFSDSEETLAQRVRKLRLYQGMTLEDAQYMTGISKAHLEAIEKGKCQATAEDVRLIATAFKTSGDYIIFGKRKGDFANGFNNQ